MVARIVFVSGPNYVLGNFPFPAGILNLVVNGSVIIVLDSLHARAPVVTGNIRHFR